MDQLGFVGRRHHDEVRQSGEISDVEAAGVRRPVRADQPGAVDGEAHRQVLDRHVVHHLVEGALQEGRIDRTERAHALRGEACGKGHRVLLGYTDVERAVRVRLGELVDPRAARHRRGDRADPLVAVGEPGERFAEHVLIGRWAARALLLLAGDDVELLHAVIFVGAVLGRGVALALLGHDVNQDRPLFGVADVLQHWHQLVEIVPVDRSDVIEPQLLEQRAAGDHPAGEFLGLLRRVVDPSRDAADGLLGEVAQVQVAWGRD